MLVAVFDIIAVRTKSAPRRHPLAASRWRLWAWIDLLGSHRSRFRHHPGRSRLGSSINKTGKVSRRSTGACIVSHDALDEICALPVEQLAAPMAHLYLWVPNALLPDGLAVMRAWGFTYKTNLVWHKVRRDGGPDGRGVGFYFRNVTELVLFGVRGKNARTLAPGRRQVNLLATRKREHSRKPDELYHIIEACSRAYLELFARGTREGWTAGATRPTRLSSMTAGRRQEKGTTNELQVRRCRLRSHRFPF